MRSKLSSLVVLSISMLGLLVASCSGDGGSRKGGGRYCLLNEADMFAVPANASKLEMKPDASTIPPGEYVFDRADLLYVDKVDLTSPQSWKIVRVVQTAVVPGKDAGTREAFSCSRGLTPALEGFSVKADSIVDLKVTAPATNTAEDGGVVTSSTIAATPRTFGFTWDSASLSLKLNFVNTVEKLSDPTEVFEKPEGTAASSEIEYGLYHAVDPALGERYQILSKETFEKGRVTVYLRVLLIKK